MGDGRKGGRGEGRGRGEGKGWEPPEFVCCLRPWFIPTPASLIAKQALINVYNPEDSMCFVWAVLSALYPVEKHIERISKYRPHLKSINLTGLTFPVPVNRVAMFEKNNPTISINVYALGKGEQELIPKFVTKCGAREKHVDLLLLSSETDDNFFNVD
jgi:hypothetical protein